MKAWVGPVGAGVDGVLAALLPGWTFSLASPPRPPPLCLPPVEGCLGELGFCEAGKAGGWAFTGVEGVESADGVACVESLFLRIIVGLIGGCGVATSAGLVSLPPSVPFDFDPSSVVPPRPLLPRVLPEADSRPLADAEGDATAEESAALAGVEERSELAGAGVVSFSFFSLDAVSLAALALALAVAAALAFASASAFAAS